MSIFIDLVLLVNHCSDLTIHMQGGKEKKGTKENIDWSLMMNDLAKSGTAFFPLGFET